MCNTLSPVFFFGGLQTYEIKLGMEYVKDFFNLKN